MRRFAFVPLPPLDLVHRGHDPLPDGAALHVAALADYGSTEIAA